MEDVRAASSTLPAWCWGSADGSGLQEFKGDALAQSNPTGRKQTARTNRLTA